MIDPRVSLDLLLCKKCGGRCCQGSPGVWVDPVRFFDVFFSGQQISLEQLRERLPPLGLVLWEKTGVPIPAPQSLASGCGFHTSGGCRLSVSEQPCQCLALLPNKETLDLAEGCVCSLPDDFSREIANQRWLEYWQAN